MIERTYRCDGPDCTRSWGTSAHRSLEHPVVSNAGRTRHFCGWDCLLRHAATHEPESVHEAP